MLIITGGIGLFLAIQSVPTLKHYGLSFFTETQWSPETDIIGIASVLLGTLTVALVAMASPSRSRSPPRCTSASTRRSGSGAS